MDYTPEFRLTDTWRCEFLDSTKQKAICDCSYTELIANIERGFDSMETCTDISAVYLCGLEHVLANLPYLLNVGFHDVTTEVYFEWYMQRNVKVCMGPMIKLLGETKRLDLSEEETCVLSSQLRVFGEMMCQRQRKGIRE